MKIKTNTSDHTQKLIDALTAPKNAHLVVKMIEAITNGTEQLRLFGEKSAQKYIEIDNGGKPFSGQLEIIFPSLDHSLIVDVSVEAGYSYSEPRGEWGSEKMWKPGSVEIQNIDALDIDGDLAGGFDNLNKNKRLCGTVQDLCEAWYNYKGMI